MASLFRNAGSFAQSSPDDEDSDSGFGSLFKKKIAPPIPVQDDIQQPTSQQTEALQSSAPQVDAGGLGSLSAPSPQKKSGILDKIKGFLGPHPEPIEKDEFGIEKPHARSHSRLSNILGIALPALFGLTSGVGIAPALLSGFSGRQGRKNRELALDTKRYEQERGLKELGLRPTSLQKDYQAYVAQETAEGRTPKSLFEYRQATAINPIALQNLDLRKTQIEDAKLDRKTRLEDQRSRDAEHQEERKTRDQDKALERISAKLGNSQDAVNTLEEIQGALGFNIDDYDPKTGTVKGKKVDLPGVSIPGLGRVTAFNDRARNLQNTAQKLFNIELKQRSGAAISDSELERLKQEFSEGKFNTEAELIAGIQRYKRALIRVSKNIEAGFRPEDLQEYEDRGGTTSSRLVGKKKAQAEPNQGQPPSGQSQRPPAARQPLAQSNDARRQGRLDFIRKNPNDPRAQELLRLDPSLAGGN